MPDISVFDLFVAEYRVDLHIRHYIIQYIALSRVRDISNFILTSIFQYILLFGVKRILEGRKVNRVTK